MRVVVHPMLEPERQIDLTERLIAAIAEELWRTHGGNDQLNWIEAEAHLRRIVRPETLELAAAGGGCSDEA